MPHIATMTRGPRLGSPLDDARPVVRTRLSQYRTTSIERLLLMTAIVLVPLEEQLYTFSRFSTVWIVFAVLASYVLLIRPTALIKTSLHPVFLATFALVFLGFVIESVHPNPSYFELRRIVEMIIGAIVVASLCRDWAALRAAMYSYIISGLGLSVVLFLTVYGTLQGFGSADFGEASRIRLETFANQPMVVNLNGLSFTIAQSGVVALALTLTASSSRQRRLFLGVALLCLVAAFLPMSRSGVIIAIVSSATIMLKNQIKRTRLMGVAIILVAGILIWVPDIVFSRLHFSTEVVQGKMEGRALIYTSAVEHLPEYVTTGVGAGNFWGWWGYYSGFSRGFPHAVVGAHNCFIQVTIYWGLAGLLALIMVVWQAYRCLPKRCRDDGLALCLLGVSISLLLLMLVMHNLYGKDFALGLGLLVAARRWVWPTGIVESASPE